VYSEISSLNLGWVQDEFLKERLAETFGEGRNFERGQKLWA
jgi:hypothetical protein